MNILPGTWYANKTHGEFWHQNFTRKYFELMSTYEDSVVMSVGKLYARLDIKAPVSKNFENLNHVIFQAPPLSPLNNSNPAYSILEINQKTTVLNQTLANAEPYFSENSKNITSFKISDIRTRHLQLYSKLMYKADKWVETSISKQFLISDLSNAT